MAASNRYAAPALVPSVSSPEAPTIAMPPDMATLVPKASPDPRGLWGVIRLFCWPVLMSYRKAAPAKS